MRCFIFKILFISLVFILVFSASVLASGGSSGGGGAEGDFAAEMPIYGDWVCSLWVRLSGWLPATPSQYWLGNIAYSAGERIPFIGAGIMYEVFGQLRTVLILVASWKVFKSLPGRF